MKHFNNILSFKTSSTKIRRNLLLVLIALFSVYAKAQDITGPWSGIIQVQGIKLRLVFNVTKNDTGYTSTMDSPDQNVKGIPVTSTRFANSVIKFEVPSAGIEYTGTLNKEGTFAGEFKQMGKVLSLNLSKGVKEKEVKVRPQDPVKPYPYYTEEVTFENTMDKVTLAGTLSLPKQDGNFPVVVLITGSGAQNRDEELVGHKPFLILADYLTRNGIGVLRYDDRGTAESKGVFGTATTADFARDVEAAVTYLKTRKEVNKKEIGLIGHSEGGIIAPMVAAKDKDIRFIVLLAGTGIRGKELLVLQSELIGRASGESEKEIQKDKQSNEEACDLVLKAKDTETLKKELSALFKKTLDENPEAKPKNVSETDYINAEVDQLANPWYQYFIKYNPSPILKDVKCPVLALNGAKDLQVPAKVNLEAIKNGLEKGGNTKVTTMELPGLNHLFQECTTGSPKEYAKIEQTMSPVALAEISKWILIQVK